MRTVVISCRALKDELKCAMDRTGVDFPVLIPGKNLHDWPDRLREELQKMLDCVVDADRVLLCFGFCGNAVLGLKTGRFEMIVPKIDDCVSLLFGSMHKRKERMKDVDSVFFTRGMMEEDGGFNSQFEHMKKRRGEESAWLSVQLMYKHQQQITVLKDGAYDASPIIKVAGIIADKCEKKLSVEEVTTDGICRLLTGPWDSAHFVVVPPNSCLTEEHLALG